MNKALIERLRYGGGQIQQHVVCGPLEELYRKIHWYRETTRCAKHKNYFTCSVFCCRAHSEGGLPAKQATRCTSILDELDRNDISRVLQMPKVASALPRSARPTSTRFANTQGLTS